MAKPNHRIRIFPDVNSLEQFIRTDGAITSIITIITDDNGYFILLYDVT